MKNINNINDFIDLINNINNINNFTGEFINTNGLSKFKSTFFEVSQYLNNKDSSSLSPVNKNLYNALNKLSQSDIDKLSVAMLTSYYTPENIITPVQNIIMGYFDDKKDKPLDILEPSAGTGNFIRNLTGKNHSIDAVELDDFTSKILQYNITDSNVTIHNKGFEDFKIDKYYDLIIGNIPFGNYNIYDKELSKEKINIVNGQIHNYFFLKSVDNLKPGGVLALMTTTSMNNSTNGRLLREYLMHETNLISCIRFNDTTFKDSNTKVISDLLILQKPLTQKLELTDREKSYINTVPSTLNPDIKVNEFIQNNIENVMGEFYLTTGIAGRTILSVKDNGDIYNDIFPIILENNFNNFSLKVLSKDDYIKVDEKINYDEIIKINEEILTKHPNIVLGNLVEENNNFYKITLNKVIENNIYYTKIPAHIMQKDKEAVSLLIQIRDDYKALNIGIKNNDSHILLKELQNNLEYNYDTFNFRYQNINDKINCKILSYDTESDLLRGLEYYVDGKYIKGDIFDQNFTVLKELKEKAATIQDAIGLSYSKHAKINIEYINQIYNVTEEEWIKEALNKNILYINPIIEKDADIRKGFHINGYELTIPSTFKSGYIDGKLEIYNSKNILSDKNIFYHLLSNNTLENAKNVLLEAQPTKLKIDEINPSLGEPWIPNDYYELFAKKHLQSENIKILYSQTLDKYTVKGATGHYGHENYSVNTENRNIYFDKILEIAMIHNIPDYTILTHIDGKEVRQVDRVTINAVQNAVDKLNDAFSKWLLLPENNKLAIDLENRYHINNRAFLKEDFNVEIFNFDNIIGKKPYLHQQAAVWQNITQLGGIIDHEVGFGKTLTMAMITMKKIELGLIKKELVIGKNANYKDLYQTYKESYPKGKFLLVQPTDLTPEKKQETFFRIMNNNFDAVFIAHSSLIQFPRAPYQEEELVKETIKDINAEISSDEYRLLTPGEKNKLVKKEIDATSNLKYIIDKINNRKRDGSIIFDDLKFDSITVDESHDFKNLQFITKHSRVSGLGNQDSVQKTDNLLAYIRNIQKIHGGDKGITFASGTTISNSITEMFLLFKYLIPTKLKENKIETFDQWARVFARKTTEYEESVSGLVKMKERFRYFVKVPELSKIYNDITNYADINTFKIERPLGQIQLITCEPFFEQENYMNKIKQFGSTKDLDHLYNYKGNPNNAKKAVGLICTSEGRKAALSMKLIDASFPDNPNDKIHQMSNKLIENYHKFNNDRGTQLIFCDQGGPDSKNFNLYNHIKEILIKKGIPSEQIAFIHTWDKKKEILFNKVNSGEIRIVIGSTIKMGVGVNMQKRITALHHLDFPWRPTDLIQRNGRGERPGNIILQKFGNKLDIFFYATKNSLDAYIFNLLQIKHNFITQIKNASTTARTVDEGVIDNNGNLNFAEYMAATSENQYLSKKLILEKQLNAALDAKYTIDSNNRLQDNKILNIHPQIKTLENTVSQLKSDYSAFTKIENPYILDSKKDKEIATNLRKLLETKIENKDTQTPLINLGENFSIVVSSKNKEIPISIDNNYALFLKTPNNKLIGYKSNTYTKDDKEVINYPYSCAAKIPEIIKNTEDRISDLKSQIMIIKNSINNSDEISNKIDELKQKIKNIDELIKNEENPEIKKNKTEKESVKFKI